MTKEQLQKLIDTLVLGQGNQVDLGSALPKLLTAFNSAMANVAEIDDFEDFSENTLYSTGDIVRYDGKLYRFIANKNKGEWDEDKVEGVTVFSLILEKLPVTATFNQSALESADLTAEQAAAAGLDALTVLALQKSDNPTIHFSDMCVTFNSVEVISDDLVNQSAIIVHTAVGGGELYKAILSLKTDGSVTYTVTQIVEPEA